MTAHMMNCWREEGAKGVRPSDLDYIEPKKRADSEGTPNQAAMLFRAAVGGRQ